MNAIRNMFAILIAATLIGGCANQKEPATQAVETIAASLETVRADAAKYASDQLQQAEGSLATLQDSLGKDDYKAVLASAPALSTQVAALTQTVKDKKAAADAAMAAATQEWQALSVDVPQMVSALQSRVDILGQAKKLPKTLSADTFKAAQSGLDTLKSTWAEATAAFDAGDPVNAVSKAQAAKQKATEVMQSLGMS